MKYSLLILTPRLPNHSHPIYRDLAKKLVCQSLGSSPTHTQELFTLVPHLSGTLCPKKCIKSARDGYKQRYCLPFTQYCTPRPGRREGRGRRRYIVEEWTCKTSWCYSHCWIFHGIYSRKWKREYFQLLLANCKKMKKEIPSDNGVTDVRCTYTVMWTTCTCTYVMWTTF